MTEPYEDEGLCKRIAHASLELFSTGDLKSFVDPDDIAMSIDEGNPDENELGGHTFEELIEDERREREEILQKYGNTIDYLAEHMWDFVAQLAETILRDTGGKGPTSVDQNLN